MNALTLKAIVARELAILGLPTEDAGLTPHAGRKTHWAHDLPCFGLRFYPSGRRVYVVQSRMDGRSRTVTIGNARLITRAQARDVARRVLLRAQTGENPADTRTAIRSIPLYEHFLQEFWDKVALRWKPSTLARNAYYRSHLEGAFPRRFLDKVEAADVERWFAAITENSGPAAANRALELLRTLFNKAHAWEVLPEGVNPCHRIERNRLRKHQCILSSEELMRFGRALTALEPVAPMQVAAIRLIALARLMGETIASAPSVQERGDGPGTSLPERPPPRANQLSGAVGNIGRQS